MARIYCAGQGDASIRWSLARCRKSLGRTRL